MIMKNYIVSYVKNGNLFESIVVAHNSDEAREFIAIKKGISSNFEIAGDYYDTKRENNHVSSVTEL